MFISWSRDAPNDLSLTLTTTHMDGYGVIDGCCVITSHYFTILQMEDNRTAETLTVQRSENMYLTQSSLLVIVQGYGQIAKLKLDSKTLMQRLTKMFTSDRQTDGQMDGWTDRHHSMSWNCLQSSQKLVLRLLQYYRSLSQQTIMKLDMCLWNMDAPGGNKVKISKSYILTSSHPRSVGCQ